MPNQDERRRYFRIEDTVRISYQSLTEAEARAREAELQNMDYASPNRLQIAERQLQLLIDKLRVQNPEFAEAIDLLNIKFNSLKDEQMDQKDQATNRPLGSPQTKKVSISACGVSFDERKAMAIGEKLFMDITLLPTDLHIYTLAEVVDCRESEDRFGDFRVAVDFYGMPSDEEEVMVQHIVKRQGRLLAARRQS